MPDTMTPEVTVPTAPVTAAPPDRQPVRVCLLGSTAAGKTCFLAGLAVLGEPNRAGPIQVHAAGKAWERLSELADTLRRQEWPPPTNTLETFHVTVLCGDRMIDLLVLDYPGGDFQKDLARLDPERIRDLYDHYSRADCLLLLLDPELDVLSLETDDPELRRQRVERQAAPLQVIRQAWIAAMGENSAGPDRRTPPDVGIVLTKTDRFPELATRGGAERFLEQHAPALMDKLRRSAGHLRVFPLSAVGATTTVAGDGPAGAARTVPAAELHPTGYDAVFNWVLRRHRRRRHRKVTRLVLGLGALLLAAAAGLGLWQVSQWRHYREVLKDTALSAEERLRQTEQTPLLVQDEQARQGLLAAEIDRLEKTLAATTTEDAVAEVLHRADHLRGTRPGALAERLDGLRQKAEAHRRRLVLQTVEDARTAGRADFKDRADRFLAQYPQGADAERVREWVQQHLQAEQKEARGRVRAVAVHNPATLQSKAERIREYLREWEKKEDPAAVARMRRAADLAVSFTQPQWYKGRLKRSGGLASPYYHMIRVTVGGQQVAEFRGPDKTTLKNWDFSRLEFQWQAGQAVGVTFLADGYFKDSVVGEAGDTGPAAVHLLRPGLMLTPAARWRSTAPDLFVDFEIEGISREDWKSFEDYVLPGNLW